MIIVCCPVFTEEKIFCVTFLSEDGGTDRLPTSSYLILYIKVEDRLNKVQELHQLSKRRVRKHCSWVPYGKKLS